MTKTETPQQRFARIEKQGKGLDKKLTETAATTEQKARRLMKDHYPSLVAPPKASGWKAGSTLIKPSGDRRPRG